MSEIFDQSTTFEQLGLRKSVLKGVDQAGFTWPTDIQAKLIPVALRGDDIIGQAKTGTGKTAAFGLPILHQADKSLPLQSLILTPTRELALQIEDNFRAYGRHLQQRTAVIVGGVSQVPQVKALQQRPEILVATPGRLLDLLAQGVLHLRDVEIAVLDEADRMLDMGFVHDVRRIARAVPERRQTMLFSATMPREIESLANRLLHEPVRLAVDPVSSTVEPIEQSVYFVGSRQKTDLLKGLLAGGEVDRALVFTRTKHGANRLAQKLGRARIETAAIHGNKSQSARQSALRRFKEGRTRVVVATDVAARGIDVKGLSHVINFDLPNEPEAYVHRIGRTGRAGESGVAISLCSPEERGHLAAIERLTRRRLDRIETPEGLASESAREERGANRARSGGQAHPRHKGGRDRSGGAGRNGRGARPKGAARASSTSGSDDPRPRNGRPSRRRPTRRR